MVENSRKYLLDVCSLSSYGVGVSANTYQCSILDAFSIVRSGVTCSYSKINELFLLRNASRPYYEKRVYDYLEYISIEDTEEKRRLVEESEFYDPPCDIICKLNTDFLVYKFFDGVRVVNVGSTLGVAQFKAYPVGDDPSGYTWQSSGTFLGLDETKVYVFQVRDFFEDETYCMVEKSISLALLVPSTTETLAPKQVFLSDISNAFYDGICYNVGCIGIDPNLTDFQRVQINYDMFAYAFGGEACVELSCKPVGESSWSKFCSTDDTIPVPTISTFTMNSGDCVCYTIVGRSINCGSCSSAYINLDSVDGLNTTTPSIDVGRCCDELINTTSKEDIDVYLDGGVYYGGCTTPTPFSVRNEGNFNFSPAIPVGNYIDIDLNILTNVDPITLGSTSNVKVFCTPDGGLPTEIINHSSNNPQPLNTTIRASYGDQLCYRLDAQGYSPGSLAESCISMTNTINSIGINSQITLPSSACVQRLVNPTPVTVSVCNQNYSSVGEYYTMNGFINAPGIQEEQCVIVNIDHQVRTLDAGISNLTISCKPNGSTGFVEIYNIDGCSYPWATAPTIQFPIRSGDTICYNGSVYSDTTGDEAYSYFCLNNLIGCWGVVPTIDVNVNKQYDGIVSIGGQPYDCLGSNWSPIGGGNFE
jgi:hypothetical protein